MAGKTTRVSVEIGAKVTGGEQLTVFSKQLSAVPDQVDTTIAADVTGTAELSSLKTDLDALPDTTDVTVSADVTGTELATLKTDLAALPASQSVSLSADVAGTELATLAGDLKALPASKSVRVDTTTTGDADIDRLVTQLSKMPTSKDVTVNAKVTSGGGSGKTFKNLEEDIDGVSGKAKQLGIDGSSFASQFLGPYSEGIGIFGDLFEQLDQLGEHADGSKGKLEAIGTIAAGLGTAVVAGLAVDTIVKAFSAIEESQTRVNTAIQTVADSLIETGGLWGQTAELALLSQIEQTDAFKEMIKSGITYQDAWAAFTDETGAGLAKVDSIMSSQGKSFGVITHNEIQDWAKVAGASKEAAKSKEEFLEQNNLLTQSQKDAKKSAEGAANGIDLVGDAARHAGEQSDYATGRLNVFNKTDIDDKESKITATDTATGKVTNYNNLKIDEKTGKITATDTATGKVHTYNALGVNTKTGRLEAVDNATGKVTTFNDTPIDDKTATVHANTDPAKTEIDSLDGRSVTLDVHARIANMTPAQQRRLFGEVVTGSFAGASPAPSVGVHAASSPAVVAPIVINVSGALDPAGTARAISQVLTRAERRTAQLRTGGRFGVSRAPV